VGFYGDFADNEENNMSAVTDIGAVYKRVNKLLSTGSTTAQAAQKMNAEFHATIYCSGDELWCSYKDSLERQQLRVIA
jgi:hypothetical protein